MTYTQLNVFYKNNEFRSIDTDSNAAKFYLLRSISKKATLKKFCKKYSLEENLDDILATPSVTVELIIDFIKTEFVPKSVDEIIAIESELNKMQNFD